MERPHGPAQSISRIAAAAGAGEPVWFKDPRNAEDGCNLQIIGGVKPVGANKWDGGWIVDPERGPDQKYDAEITALSDEKLKVMGPCRHETPARDHGLDARSCRP